MQTRRDALALAAAFAAAPAFAQTPERLPAEGSNGAWLIEGGAERATDAKVAPFLGREALWLRNSTHAIAAGSAMTDGTIEFDLAPMDPSDFVAIVFRRASLADHENIYLRIRQSGAFMALQYAPRTRGSSTWQLYPEFNVAVDWPRNRWTHVRVEVRGSRLEVHLNGAETPSLVVPRLRHDSPTGEVALWARVNNEPAKWAAAISNFQVRPASASIALSPPAAPPAGYIARWAVTGPAADASPPPAGATWVEAAAEESGLVKLNQLWRIQPGKSLTGFGRVMLTSGKAQRVRLGVGYSDDVTVWLNGEPVYSGINAWDSRTPQLTSFVDARWETAYLPLRRGRNELLLAVTDDQRFGWGFSAKLDPALGIRASI